jgi:hypothetical protein
MVLAIDPGNEQSAYVVLNDTYKPTEFGILPNEKLINRIQMAREDYFVIEMVASYGMAVGATVFETVFWIGRFFEKAATFQFGKSMCHRIYRKDEKMCLCHSMKAKDSNIRQALIDRFGEVGTKKSPGWFYGFKKDIWAAYAVGVTFLDIKNGLYQIKEANK